MYTQMYMYQIYYGKPKLWILVKCLQYLIMYKYEIYVGVLVD